MISNSEATMTDWDSLDDGKYRDEAAVIADLLAAQPLSSEDRAAVRAEAEALVRGARRSVRKQGVVESFLQEFSLGTREGLALMCLAEALLRTPDDDTRDKLIAEKIGSADWASHLGGSDSLFVNASTWGLMLTGKIVEPDDQAQKDLPAFIKKIAGRLGEPVIRAAVGQAIRIMGEQFVLGRTIEAAIKRAANDGDICSFDMLGEGARTAADAARYEKSYADAILTVGKLSNRAGPEAGHGVSVKLSALTPRYEATQEARVWDELYPRVLRLALIAAKYDINFTIDAEEADRLALSLKLLDRLCREPELGDWTGLGLAVQAYQKRCPEVIARLTALSKETGRRLMVRLVKGAYWDSEIKRAQVAGRPDYPVYTTKPATDLSYLVCAKALIEAAPHLYAQFATHNAHTLAAVVRMSKNAGVKIEHQRLHGMGEALYKAADDLYDGVVLRAYAPVGGHEDLLPYLVRRLLENGANTSFVHALLDERVPVEKVVVDPITAVEAHPDRHAKIPTPINVYGPRRKNSAGLDLSVKADRDRLAAHVAELDKLTLSAGPLIGGKLTAGAPPMPVQSPTDHDRVVGVVSEAQLPQIDQAFKLARAAQPAWDQAGGPARAEVLRAMGDALEANIERLCAILAREAGKTLPDAIAEVREAVDFCRYYAKLAEEQFGLAGEVLTGPVGETNTLRLAGRGVFVCISPWNFPLAIFTGQIAAALAAGNAVLAKPAEQTPLIAIEAVKLYHAAGLDHRLLALLPGPRRDGRRGPDRPRGPGRRGLHRRHRHRLADQPDARPAPRPDRAVHRRDRRAERHVRRHHRPARAGDRRRDPVGLRQRRPALLGPAPAVPARRHRRPHHRRPEGRDGRPGHRRPGPGRHRRRPGDRPRGQGGAGQAPGAPEPRSQGAAHPAGAGDRHVLRPGPGRDPGRRLPGARGVRPRAARGALPARRPGTGRRRPGGPPLRPDPGRPLADRELRGRRPAPGPGRQLLRQPLDDRRRGRRPAVRRRGPVGHRPQGRRPPRPAALRGRAGAERQHHRPGRRSDAAESVARGRADHGRRRRGHGA
jgi:RHH-type proline utilization regulon transcriptional repressor/proline dehydrogenase/delta 1-pyrroline-5-carboxylate dehydrogenase